MAKVQRLVGIDFGTSTSIVKVKRYEGDSPVGDSHTSSSVTFGNGESDSKAVTAVRINREGATTCGAEALEQLPGSTVCKEFKMDLESPDREKRRQAMERTEDYFRYLYSWYDHQRSDLGAIDDEERTLVSYPVKWRPEAREYLLETARSAGFQNVSGMDEATAALYATLCRKMSEINQQGLLRAGESGYMLLVDMGAGTTDLAVCRYRVKAGGPVVRADQIENEIISTWPMGRGAATFGGREVDRVLEEYIIDYLKSCGFPAGNAEQAVRGSGNSSTAAKRWKETTVSKLLNDGKRVESCAFVAPFMMLLPQAKPFPAFGRREFEEMLGEKLEDFRDLVAGCLTQASRAEPELLAKKLDLVILTGGHSSWYFAEELLNGVMPGLSLPQLELVQRERSRVIRLSNPQETVALGLVYSQLPFQVAAEKEETPAAADDRRPTAAMTETEPAAPADREPAGTDGTAKTTGNTAATFKDKVKTAVQAGKILTEAVVMTATEKKEKPQPAAPASTASRMPEKWPANDQLAMCVKEFIQTYDQDFIKKFAESNAIITVMQEKLSVPSAEAVLLIHDDTWMSNGKNGFLLCTSGIFCKPLIGARTFTSWLAFATGNLLPFNGDFMCRSSFGAEQHIAYYTRKDAPALYQFLTALQAHLRTRFRLPEVPKQTLLLDAGSAANEQLAQSAKAFIKNYAPDTIHRITRGDPQKVMEGLEIPSGAEMYLYHDDTLLKGGKNGFAITDRGFYCRKPGGKPVFTEWRAFFSNSLLVDPNAKYGQTLCRRDAADDLTKPVAYCQLNGSYGTTDPFVFIAHLHAYLRSLYA